MKKSFTILLSILFLQTIHAQDSHPTVSGHELSYRFVRISTNFLVDENLPEILEVITDAAKFCYNGVILSDVKFGYLDEYAATPNYIPNLNTFLDSAKALNLKVYPETTPFGYSSPILWHDPNLVEALPVYEAPFIVESINGQLVLNNHPDDVFNLQNGDFEMTPTNGDEFPNWSWQDDPGSVTLWDNNNAYSGNASAHVQNPGQNPNGNARIVQEVAVDDYRDYHISFWVKTENFDPAYTNVYIIDPDNNRSLQNNPFSVEVTQDWTKYDLTFNTLDSDNLAIYFGVWGGGNGDLWWDNIEITPTRFNNVINRTGAPIHAVHNNVSINEGVEIDYIIDPLSGNDPWPGAFSIWHEQPLISIPSNSNLQEGDVVDITYWHAGIVNNGQVTASLTEPAVFDITEIQIHQILDFFYDVDMFDGWFLSYDEIRVHGWDETDSYGSTGEDLAYNFTTVYNQARDLSQDAKIMTWSDMFDPYHNAYDGGDPYYLVNGFWNNSWEGVPNDVIIFNWNSGENRIASGQFFADRGHAQVLAGYYDEANYYTPDWLEDLNGTQNIQGVMYTTWENNFDDLGTWADQVWGTCRYEVNTEDLSTTDSGLTIFPNPSSGRFSIQNPNQLNLQQITISNTLGQVVFESNENLNNTLYLENYPKGIYLVNVRTDQGIFLQKIILE